MKALFVMQHPGAARNFESVIRGLADRGHEVRVAFESIKTQESLALVERIADECPRVSHRRTPRLARGPYGEVARTLRYTADLLRYLEPRYATAGRLRERAAREAPAPVRLLARLPLGRAAAPLRRIVQAVERTLPPTPSAEQFLADERPDVLLVTPLVGLGSHQADLVRAARRLGIPAVFPVHSWDNLTNKGLLRDVPDLALVWNEAQVDEAVELHGVPRDRVVATGATAYDHWFEWTPARDAAQLRAEVGLPPGGALVLYVCSSPFIAPDEVPFVRRWLAALRAAGPPLADAAVIVRPHPQHAAQWAGVDLGDERAVVWPAGGEDPISREAKRNYFDSLFHAGAVVGVNTSALIESAIVGRPVHTVVTDEFRATQEGTLHFHYLASESGHLLVARSLEEHCGQLAQSLAGGAAAARNRPFLESFVRPHGLDRPATPLALDAIEEAVRRGPAPWREPLLAPFARRGLRPVEARLRRARRAARVRAGDELDHARRVIDALGADDRPVVAGPWFAEVGYELLYWIPFLRRAVQVVPGLAERLVIVSRGGVASWYTDISTGYVELYDHARPAELTAMLAEVATETRGLRKQMVRTALDDRLLADVRRAHGLENAHVLHPSLMFGVYRRLAKRHAYPLAAEGDLFAYAPLPRPAPVAGLARELPDDYVAVRFYFNPSFPETDGNSELAAQIVAELAKRHPVVLLNPPGRYDDHHDLELGDARVHRLEHLMHDADNLGVQTAVVAGARAFAGTYGGLSYLAPFLGVQAVSVYSDAASFRSRHLELAQRLATRPGFGGFVALGARDLEIVAAVAAGVAPVDVTLSG